MKAAVILLLLVMVVSVSSVSPPDDFGVAGYYANVLVEKKAYEKNVVEVEAW